MDHTNPPHHNQLQNPYLSFELEMFREYLRQNQQTFNMNVAGMLASLAIATVGSFAIFHGKAIEGTFTTTAGTGGLALCCKRSQESSRESAKKLEKLLKELKAASKS